MKFRSKKIRGTETLGELLARHREDAHLSQKSIARALNIQERYVVALESGRYDHLPGDLYVRRILEQYARILLLPLDRVMDRYETEQRIVEACAHQPRNNNMFDPKRLPQTIITPKRLRVGAATLGVLSLLAYIGVQVQQTTEQPALIVTPSRNDIVLNEHSILIEGTTDPEAKVTINNKEVVGTREGHFSETIHLNKGVNILEITAKKKRSDATTVYKKIFVES